MEESNRSFRKQSTTNPITRRYPEKKFGGYRVDLSKDADDLLRPVRRPGTAQKHLPIH
jgi:hypothetical protein